MTEKKNYKKTLVACYLGFVTQAISANFTPLLFLTFKGTYGITLDKIALIPLVFYLTQLLVDLAATKFADKIGYRACVAASQVLSSAGLVLMAVLPELLPVPFIGIIITSCHVKIGFIIWIGSALVSMFYSYLSNKYLNIRFAQDSKSRPYLLIGGSYRALDMMFKMSSNPFHNL